MRGIEVCGGSGGSIRQIAHRTIERTRRYLDATGGNPFLATQIIDSLARSAAGGERDAVAGAFVTAMTRRLAGLSSSARELVELVAAAGRRGP